MDNNHKEILIIYVVIHLLVPVLESEAISTTLSRKAPHNHFALLETAFAACFTSSFSYPDSTLCCTFLKPLPPSSFVFPPNHNAFSFAD